MSEGHEVTVIDNFFTGRKKNVEHWYARQAIFIVSYAMQLCISSLFPLIPRIGHQNFELVHHDVVENFMIEVDEVRAGLERSFFSSFFCRYRSNTYAY